MKYFPIIFLVCCAGVAKGGHMTLADYFVAESPSGSTSAGSPIKFKTPVDCLFQGDKHIRFYLHNHHDLNNPHKLEFNSTINSEWLNIHWKTVLFLHGWKAGNRFSDVMKKAYLEESDHHINLIEVDWFKGAYNPLYCPSAKRVPNVGETVAKFIGHNHLKLNLNKLIIVGHSLGAHAAGFAGKFLQSDFNFRPQLIIGLDPAGPLFRGITTKKLQPDDAENVLVIHTSQKFGHLEPLGTLDIYINGGKIQPGCTDSQSHGFAKLIYKEMVNGMEPHVGHRYTSFTEVMNDIIPATEEIQLGRAATLQPRGTLLYVATNEQPHLIDEVKEFIDSKLEKEIANCCLIL